MKILTIYPPLATWIELSEKRYILLRIFDSYIPASMVAVMILPALAPHGDVNRFLFQLLLHSFFMCISYEHGYRMNSLSDMLFDIA